MKRVIITLLSLFFAVPVQAMSPGSALAFVEMLRMKAELDATRVVDGDERGDEDQEALLRKKTQTKGSCKDALFGLLGLRRSEKKKRG